MNNTFLAIYFICLSVILQILLVVFQPNNEKIVDGMNRVSFALIIAGISIIPDKKT
jgi:uncharacterized membrane protein